MITYVSLRGEKAEKPATRLTYVIILSWKQLRLDPEIRCKPAFSAIRDSRLDASYCCNWSCVHPNFGAIDLVSVERVILPYSPPRAPVNPPPHPPSLAPLTYPQDTPSPSLATP